MVLHRSSFDVCGSSAVDTPRKLWISSARKLDGLLDDVMASALASYSSVLAVEGQ